MSGPPLAPGVVPGGAAARERAVLGHWMGAHPCRAAREQARAAGLLGLAAAVADLELGERVPACAVPVKVWERRTRAGDWMAQVVLEDSERRAEAVCFPRAWDACADEVEEALRRGDPLAVSLSGAADRVVLESARPLLVRRPLPSGPPLGAFAVLDLETSQGAEPPAGDPAWAILGGRRRGKAGERAAWLASQQVVEVGVALFEPVGGGAPRARGEGGGFGWRLAQKLSRLVRPRDPISEGSRAVHGISDADVAGEPPFAERAARLAAALRGRVLVTYNGRGFDLPVLGAEFARAEVALGLARGSLWSTDPAETVDAYDLVRTRYRGRRDRPQSKQLAHQCAFHGVPTGQSHRAGDDAAATGELLVRMIEGGWAPLGLDDLRRGARFW